jgi:predicted GNAT family N-acyltransferase
MDATGFHVEPASWEADRDELLRIREQVFVVEQNVPVEDERDALDPGSRHVLAHDADGRAIGTGRLTARHTIGRMAVLAEWRGRGSARPCCNCCSTKPARWAIHRSNCTRRSTQSHSTNATASRSRERNSTNAASRIA